MLPLKNSYTTIPGDDIEQPTPPPSSAIDFEDIFQFIENTLALASQGEGFVRRIRCITDEMQALSLNGFSAEKILQAKQALRLLLERNAPYLAEYTGAGTESVFHGFSRTHFPFTWSMFFVLTTPCHRSLSAIRQWCNELDFYCDRYHFGYFESTFEEYHDCHFPQYFYELVAKLCALLLRVSPGDDRDRRVIAIFSDFAATNSPEGRKFKRMLLETSDDNLKLCLASLVDVRVRNDGLRLKLKARDMLGPDAASYLLNLIHDLRSQLAQEVKAKDTKASAVPSYGACSSSSAPFFPRAGAAAVNPLASEARTLS